MAAKIEPAANSLEEASIILDGHNPLDPSDEKKFKQFYVSRPVNPKVESRLIREAKRAIRANRTFNWFYTGHTGSGKSTELNRLMADPKITEGYLPIYIDLAKEFDIYNIEYTDIIFAYAKACFAKAKEIECNIPKDLEESIENWGAEIIKEEIKTTQTEGESGIAIEAMFVKLGETIKSGGEKKVKIRQDISQNPTNFISIVDELAEQLQKNTYKKPLCILDGLDHADVQSSINVLYSHYETLILPNISKVFVIPLSLLNTPFLGKIEKQYSTIPNIKVFKDASSEEIDTYSFGFFKDVIGRYISLNFFTDAALQSLYKLSAGILRDMIRNVGDACAYANDAGATIVDEKYVTIVWNEMKSYYRRQLFKKDYEILKRVDEERHIQGIDGIPPLLHNKAIVFYPNGEGWYGVHPAVQEILNVQ
jgi:hypothetical protein